MLYRDRIGNEWARGVTESIPFGYRPGVRRASCRFFSPSQNGKLVFNIKNTGSDDLLLESVMLHFVVQGSMFDSYKYRSGHPSGYLTLVFTWNGMEWFHDENQDSWHDIGFRELTTGYRLDKIYAWVPKGNFAGTDSEVYLKLKNRDTGEECETNVLNGPLDDWYFGSQSFGEPAFLAPCSVFSPPQNGALMFNIKIAGSDDLLLTSVSLYFRYHGSDLYPNLVFRWKGSHWFHSENQDSWHALIMEQ